MNEKIKDYQYGPTWEIKSSGVEPDARGKTVWGTLVLDVDGTLTVPGQEHAIDIEVIGVLADFLKQGGNLVFCTGATLGRVERTVLTPLYGIINHSTETARADDLFKQVIVMPENGSALLLNRGVSVVENELQFDWFRIHELHVPDKEELRTAIDKELVTKYPNSYIAGDHVSDPIQRDYILSLKGVSDTLMLKRYIEKELAPKYPEIDWDKISLKAARTTIDFIHADSGKTVSVEWVLKELARLSGKVIGFGDLGDEFAKVVPTINVNKKRPNEFRLRRMPSMDLTGGWRLLGENGYVITGEGPSAKVRDKRTDREMQVLRNRKGEIIYANEAKNGFLSATMNEGRPVEIKPLTCQENGKEVEIEDAGKGTAWMIGKLLSAGYFDCKGK